MFLPFLLAAGLLAASPVVPAAQLGETPPALEAVRWYNTPPLALERLHGKAVLVEVFRTW